MIVRSNHWLSKMAGSSYKITDKRTVTDGGLILQLSEKQNSFQVLAANRFHESNSYAKLYQTFHTPGNTLPDKVRHGHCVYCLKTPSCDVHVVWRCPSNDSQLKGYGHSSSRCKLHPWVFRSFGGHDRNGKKSEVLGRLGAS